MARVRTLLSLSAGADFHTVLRQLGTHGFDVEESHEDLGFVAGNCDENVLRSITKVRGVAYVERGSPLPLPDLKSTLQ
jgi:hypothetical protein